MPSNACYLELGTNCDFHVESENICRGALSMVSQANTVLDPSVEPPFTREKLQSVIDKHREQMKANCLADQYAFELAIEYAEHILSQM